ncbi:MAG: response regulator [Deltaproteobacteria bacterium]|nr:MAG: response regulator [Deltaproteobacteria bacterium]
MKHKVLIVDDEQSTRKLMKEALGMEPYELLVADSAEKALEIFRKEPVDVVISDEMMPGMPGSEFLALVRKKYPDTIRMILTGHASVEGAIKAINEGQIYHFFTKPCRIYDLAITVRKALQQKELMKKSRQLLRLAQRQSTFIDEIEKKYPGITRVKKDDRGEILLDDGVEEDYDALIHEIKSVLRKETREPRKREY